MGEKIIKPTNAKTKPFDVSRPGKTPPSSSSRPVIITNQPEQADPMLTGDSQSKELDMSQLTTPPAEAPIITPTLDKAPADPEKSKIDSGPSLVTVSSEAIVKPSPLKKYGIIAGVVIIALALLIYYG
jgi:hypothetical protein